MHLFLRIFSGVADSVDPNKTASSGAVKEQCDLSLHCLHMLFCQTLLVQNLRTFTVGALYTFRNWFLCLFFAFLF